MSGFLDELEMLDEAKETPETIPGGGIRKITTGEYMGRLPEHQADDIDIQPRDEQIRRQQEPGLDRPVVSKKVQVQRIPGNGIRKITTGEYMRKLPEKADVDAVEPTKDTACTLRPFAEDMETLKAEISELKSLIKENTVSQATPITGSANAKPIPPRHASEISKVVNEDEEDLIVEDGKKVLRRAAVGGAVGAVGGATKKAINDKLEGKKTTVKDLAVSGLIGGASGAATGAALAWLPEKVSKKVKGKKSESFKCKIKDGHVSISEDTMQYLMETFEYELNEEQIMALVAEAATVPETIPGSGIKDTTTGRYMTKLPQYQSVEEAKPRKEDEAYSGKGSIVNPHDVSGADDVEDNLADDEIDDCLEEEVIYEYDPEIMKIYMEATDYKYSALEICQMIDEATMMDDIEDGYHRLKEKNPTLAGAAKGLAYASTGGLGGVAYGIHKKRRAKREGKEVEKWGVAKSAAKGAGYGILGVATGGLGAAALGAVRGKSKDNEEKARKYDNEKKDDKKKSEAAELAVPTPKKVQKQELPGDGIKKMNIDGDKKFDNDAYDPQKDQQFEENTDIEVSIFNPIKLNENEVRIVEQYGKYLISESDYESLCYNYAGKLNGYEVLDLVAESHNIDPDDLYVMIAEGESVSKKGCKKAMSCKGSSDPKCCDKRKEAKIARLQAQLKDTASGSATAKELRRKIKELRKS